MASEINELLEGKESETLEFKKSTAQLEKALKSICAFLNHKGGVIYFGIDKDGKAVGQSISDNTIRSISQKIRQRIKPAITPEVKVLEINKKKVIEVKVKKGDNKPYYLDGIAYKRVGTENPVISPEELERTILEKRKRYWDSEICEGASCENIDEEKVKWFVKEAKRHRSLKLSDELLIKEILMRLRLLKDRKLTNAALLLFSEEPMFLQSEIKCIRFSGNEPVKPYIDFASIEGTVFDLVNGAEDFVLRNIRKAIWLVPEQIQREERYEYPPDAIREAVVNAVVHRDYENPSKVQVRIFDNRIEIWSPGLLPEGLSVEDLKREHRSIPRNPLLFKQLFWVKYVEDVGSGTLDMMRLCKEWEILEPEFKHITGAFVVIFRLPPSIEDLEKLGLNERQIKAVEYVKKSGSITSGEYQRLNNTTRYTASRDLAKLVESGIFSRVGKGKRELRYILLSMQNASKMRQTMRQS